jgi:hypothetical protein
MCTECKEMVSDVPKRDWVVRFYTDLGPGERYRYRTSGENLNWPIGHRNRWFSWRVPNLDPRDNLDTAQHVAADDTRHF